MNSYSWCCKGKDYFRNMQANAAENAIEELNNGKNEN
jgi:hypothetical protein